MLLVVLLLVPQSAGAFWQCEGRVCGTNAWACCCATPQKRPDLKCDSTPTRLAPSRLVEHRRSSSHEQEVSACPAACHCTMVMQGKDASARAATPFSAAPALFVAVLPAFLEADAPQTPEALPPFDSRGPPLRAVSLATPSLRGPPTT